MLQESDLAKKEKGHRSLALLDIYLGKLKAAQEHFEEAVRFAMASKSSLSELRNRLYLGRAYLIKGGNDAFEKEMNAVRQIQRESKISPDFIYEVGRAYARSSRLKEAIQQLEDLKSGIGDVLALSGLSRSNQGDQAAFYLLKGEVELAQKRYDEAINSFKTAASLGRSNVSESLGYAFLRSGNLEKAAEKYEEFLKNYRIYGSETLERWILSHYELAKIFEQKGQPEEAIKYYERFLEIWKDGDPDLPVLIDAKRRLAKLKAGP
jgi:tetratricopeptide (TPR) repeat protein